MENYLRWKTPFKQRRPFTESFAGQAVEKKIQFKQTKIDGSKVEISIFYQLESQDFLAKRTNSEKNPGLQD